ncbi:hypothetical protein [Paraburkholderia graminis]|uniref:Uncharacterized protein n=1 Tax=Paraburkholderia graminis TaxID=60548 RepID=A0ABD5C923_9BURK|nr:hypothetical protein [Paraburkholderia graminis]MDR6201376.1 hypothetical protein [Paraburkholderia graminis]
MNSVKRATGNTTTPEPMAIFACPMPPTFMPKNPSTMLIGIVSTITKGQREEGAVVLLLAP